MRIARLHLATAAVVAAAIFAACLFAFEHREHDVPYVQVRNDKREIVAYAVPTIHFGLAARMRIGAPLREIVAHARRTYLELDLDDPEAVAHAREVFQALNASRDYSHSYADPLREAVLRRLTASGMATADAQAAIRRHPFFLVGLLESPCYASTVRRGTSVDHLVKVVAQAAGRESRSMDQPEDFARALAHLPPDLWPARVSAAMAFAASPGCAATVSATYAQVARAYANGDFEQTKRLVRGLETSVAGNAVLVDKLVDADERNEQFARRIDDEVRGGLVSVFVIGAIHFAGDRSVAARLAARGYTVENCVADACERAW